MKLPLLKNANVTGKTVFLRADLDVPLGTQNSKLKTQNYNSKVKIEDDTRLIASLSTIEYLLKNQAKVIIAGHLGRPKGIDRSLSLEPVARWFSIKYKVLSIRYGKRGGFDGWEITPKLFLLENLRFYNGEEKNDKEFAKKLASLADLYVNDAFAMCHRCHASIVGITEYLPHFAGFHLEQEIENLGRVIDHPQRPLIAIIGGKKIETKLPIVSKMHKIADYVLVGGKIAEESQVFIKLEHKETIGKKSVLIVAELTPDGTGITEKSLNRFLDIIPLAKTVIWNGSMGYIGEKEDQFQATRKIAEAIIKSRAFSVVGGGDTVDFLNRIKALDKFSFVSTGGGAMLSFLSGEKLPGLEALTI